MRGSVKIHREPPTPRSIFKELVGHMEVDIKSIGYLHIGSEPFSIPASLAHHVKQLVSKKGQVDNSIVDESIVDEISRMMDSAQPEFATLKEKLVIPGASVKGNIRARLELSFVPLNNKVRSCFRVSDYETYDRGWRHAEIWKEAVHQNREQPCSLTSGGKRDRATGGHRHVEKKGAGLEETQKVCIICDMFGAPGLAGLVEFTDFLGPPASDKTVEELRLPYGVKLKAAKPGSVFSGQIYFKNLSPVKLGLLFYGMGLRDDCEGRTVLLGKYKYRRYGKGGHVLGVVKYSLKRLALSKLSKPSRESQVPSIDLQPGEEVSGDRLKAIVKTLVETVKNEFKEELQDIDEVGRLEQLGSHA
ncbi:RAMP superfamily CRISPR-associated protein [Thermosphaera sp.]